MPVETKMQMEKKLRQGWNGRKWESRNSVNFYMKTSNLSAH